MDWKQYAAALILTNAVMMAVGYLVLRLQSLPIFNPNGVGSMAPDLSFHTIISFMTNTNLQHYAGESGLSDLSQMLVITFMMFVSAASGYAACAAFIRGITGRSKTSVGNFYEDLVRITTRILLPFSLVGGLLLARLRVTQRRLSMMPGDFESSSVFTNGQLKIDYSAGCAWLWGEELHLTPIEYKLLCLLSKNVGWVLTHTYITQHVWGRCWDNDVSSLRVFMATLRKKLESAPNSPQYIQTHVGVGYRMLRV